MSSEYIINDFIWSEFVDSGYVPPYQLVLIGKKISNGCMLTERESSVYTTHSKDIEDIIKKIKILNGD